MIYVKYKKLTDTAMVPTRGSARAAGYDLYADTDKDIMMWPGEVVEFFTGLALEIPDGYFGAVYPRSGLATKLGLRLPNCVGVIDSDYRGNVGIPLRNDSGSPVTVKAHERVAQIIIQPCPDIVLSETKELSETDRGTAGFGSTGRT